MYYLFVLVYNKERKTDYLFIYVGNKYSLVLKI